MKKDLVGKKFNRLTILEILNEIDTQGLLLCNAQCDCGNLVKISASLISRGKTKSCGCIRREKIKAVCETNKTHGKSRTQIYYLWRGIIKRCNKKSDNRYGGRGISVCERWLKFENFYADMGEMPKNMSIERIDNNGNYEPSNCRWASDKEQSNNRSTNIKVEFNGEVMSLAQLSDKLKISRPTIYSRYQRGVRGNDLIKRVV
jgi:hypothetical protein